MFKRISLLKAIEIYRISRRLFLAFEAKNKRLLILYISKRISLLKAIEMYRISRRL